MRRRNDLTPPELHIVRKPSVIKRSLKKYKNVRRNFEEAKVELAQKTSSSSVYKNFITPSTLLHNTIFGIWWLELK